MTTLPDFSPNRPKPKYITYRQESKDNFQFFFQPPRTPRAPRKKSKIGTTETTISFQTELPGILVFVFTLNTLAMLTLSPAFGFSPKKIKSWRPWRSWRSWRLIQSVDSSSWCPWKTSNLCNSE
jgi:hypothetical protein